jgi:hypothetical protein
MKRILIISLIAITAVSYSCKPKNKTEETKPTQEKTMESPAFDGDSAYAFVAAQVAFGPRVPGTKAHNDCAKWMTEKLKSYCKNVIEQPFKARLWDGKTVNGKNIIASFNPDNKVRIFLSAHWDSRPYADHDADAKNHKTPIDGANDGASGVGVLIEMARQMSIKNPAIGVDIVLFDVEDWGEPQDAQSEQEDNWCLGSQYWARNPHVQGYKPRFGILLDMVGAANAEFAKEGTSMYYAPDVMNKVWDIAGKLGFGSSFVARNSNGITDDHLYINKIASIPTIDIIQHDPSTQSGFNKHWHTINDNISNINKETLAVVGKVCLAVVYQEK